MVLSKEGVERGVLSCQMESYDYESDYWMIFPDFFLTKPARPFDRASYEGFDKKYDYEKNFVRAISCERKVMGYSTI